MLKLAPRYALKSVPLLFVLSLLLPLAHGVAATSPSGSKSTSFKSGFSSQRSSSPSPSKGSFGSFGKRSSSSSSPAAEPSQARGGGFGSFGRAAPSDARRSDSALSRKLDRDASEARALRTLEERRAAQAARNAPLPRPDDNPRRADNLPPPGYGNGYGNGYGGGQAPGYGRMPPPDNGLGRVIAGAVIANAAANAAAHAANNGAYGRHGSGQAPAQPAPSWNGGVDSVGGPVATVGTPAAQPAHARGGSVFGTVLVLLVLALAGWIAYKWIMRTRAKREANKPNYSFERN